MGKYNVSRENFEKFKNGKLAVNCTTEEQAKEFVKWCFDNDFKWAFGFSNDVTYFNYYGKKTCYRYIYSGILVYSSKESNQELRIEILTFDEFMGIKQEVKELDYKSEYEKLLNENQDLKEFVKEQEEYLHKKYCFEIEELVKERNKLLEENKQLRGKQNGK